MENDADPIQILAAVGVILIACLLAGGGAVLYVTFIDVNDTPTETDNQTKDGEYWRATLDEYPEGYGPHMIPSDAASTHKTSLDGTGYEHRRTLSTWNDTTAEDIKEVSARFEASGEGTGNVSTRNLDGEMYTENGWHLYVNTSDGITEVFDRGFFDSEPLLTRTAEYNATLHDYQPNEAGGEYVYRISDDLENGSVTGFFIVRSDGIVRYASVTRSFEDGQTVRHTLVTTPSDVSVSPPDWYRSTIER